MNDVNSRLGTNLKILRQKRRLTQQDIANEVGVTKQTICKIEKGSSANQTTIERIAKALSVDVKELYEPLTEDNEEDETFKIDNFLTRVQKQNIIHKQIYPMLEYINDIISEKVSNTIREVSKSCLMNEKSIKAYLKKKGYSSQTYTEKEVIDICKLVIAECMLKAIESINQTMEK